MERKFKPGDRVKQHVGKEFYTVVGYTLGGLVVVEDENGYIFREYEKQISPYREPIKIKGWLNVYEGDYAEFYNSRDTADKFADERTVCIYVEGTEGDEPE